MQPISSVDGVSATQAVTCSNGLVPRHRLQALRFLEPDGRVKDQDVGTHQNFEMVKDHRMAHQVCGPVEQQIRFQPVGRLSAARILPLDTASPNAGLAYVRGFFVRQHLSSGQESVLFVRRDFFSC